MSKKIKEIITLDINIANELYDLAESKLSNLELTMEILDNRLIRELFAREVAKHIANTHPIDVNEFIRVDTNARNKPLKLSVGKLNLGNGIGDKITYGII